MSIKIFILAIVAYYALHSILATNAVKRFLSPLIPIQCYRFFFNIVAVSSLIPIVLIYLQITPSKILENQVVAKFAGIFLLLLGTTLLFISLRQYDLKEFIGSKYLTPKSRDQKNVLQTTGLNSIVRHPLYLATLMIVWGWFLKRASSADLLIAVLTSLYLFIGIYLEEQKLITEFGEPYLVYKKKVKMLIPFLI